jgi:hypothetical protein
MLCSPAGNSNPPCHETRHTAGCRWPGSAFLSMNCGRKRKSLRYFSAFQTQGAESLNMQQEQPIRNTRYQVNENGTL